MTILKFIQEGKETIIAKTKKKWEKRVYLKDF